MLDGKLAGVYRLQAGNWAVLHAIAMEAWHEVSIRSKIIDVGALPAPDA
jgi:hypothetical protein